MSKMSLNIVSLEIIGSSLTCFVCDNLATDPYKCPKCPKFACKVCFTMHVQEHKECPECHSNLISQELVHSDQYEKIMRSLIQSLQQQQEQQQSVEKCPVHSEILNIYCGSCKDVICYECIISGKQHQNHDCKSLRKTYENYSSQMSREIGSTKKTISEKRKAQKERATCLKNQRSKELMDSFKTMISRSTKKFDKKTEMFMSEENTAIHQIEQELKDSGQIAFMRKWSSLSENLEKVKNKLKNRVEPVAIDFENEYVPPWSARRFMVKDFEQVRRKGQYVESENLKINELTWKVIVFPNGCDSGEATNAVAAKLMFCGNDSETSPEVQYELVMLHPKETARDIVKKGVAQPVNQKMHTFGHIDKLIGDGFLDPNTKGLHFECRIRFQTYFQQCQRQNLCIGILKEQLAILQAENRKPAVKVRALSELQEQKNINNNRISENHQKNNLQDDTENTSRSSRKRSMTDQQNSEKNTENKKSKKSH